MQSKNFRVTKNGVQTRVSITNEITKLNFWSISRKEILETQQKHALKNTFLRILLCSNDILNPCYKRKTRIRKRTSLLDGVCFIYEQLFHPIQCTACRKCQCSSRSKHAWQEVFVFSQH